ncbi:MAG: nucleotide exchange factor GrpE [Weeksellaceae bacterium]
MKKQPEDEEVLDNVVSETDEPIESAEDTEMAALQQQVDEGNHRYLRALADYKNLEQRVQTERERMRDTIKRQTIESFFPVLDNIDQAEVFTQDPGLKIVAESFRKVLKELGVKELDLAGKPYDPYNAEAVEVVPGEEDDMVVEVLQKGYELNGTVIRHAKVKVSKAS